MPLPAYDLTLAWVPSPTPGVTGYRLYTGTASGQYTDILDVGPSTTATVTNLEEGFTYFFAVTSYNAAGMEGDFCNEISYAIPIPAPIPTLAPTASLLKLSPAPASPVSLICTGPAYSQYDLLTSTDLITWKVVASVTMDSTGHYRYTPPGGGLSHAVFYRLRPTPPAGADNAPPSRF